MGPFYHTGKYPKGTFNYKPSINENAFAIMNMELSESSILSGQYIHCTFVKTINRYLQGYGNKLQVQTHAKV